MYHAAVPGASAQAFVLRRLLRHDQTSFDALLPAGQDPWIGLKIKMGLPMNAAGTLTIEPLIADPRNLYVDLDAQYAEVVDVASFGERITSVDTFVQRNVKQYVERSLEG